MARYGTVEIGGTKTLYAVGASPDDLAGVVTVPTTEPEETIEGVVEFFGREVPDAVGIASFGPLDLGNGRIGITPKPGWSGTDLLGPVRAALDLPVGLDTDVNGAALGEARWGTGRGLDSFVYVTVGTGIGGGALIGGEPVHGLGHPEMGHVVVRRHHDDDYEGVCRLHGDCLEGLASGPAITGRFGRPGEGLAGTDLARAVEFEAFYLAQMARDLVYILAPERVALGGGVSRLPGLLELVNLMLVEDLAGYPGMTEHESGFVVAPGLGALSGLAGGLILAERAVGKS